MGRNGADRDPTTAQVSGVARHLPCAPPVPHGGMVKHSDPMPQSTVEPCMRLHRVRAPRNADRIQPGERGGREVVALAVRVAHRTCPRGASVREDSRPHAGRCRPSDRFIGTVDTIGCSPGGVRPLALYAVRWLMLSRCTPRCQSRALRRLAGGAGPLRAHRAGGSARVRLCLLPTTVRGWLPALRRHRQRSADRTCHGAAPCA